MKKILLISDTHGYLDPALEKYFSNVDEVWHAGDIGALDLDSILPAGKEVKAVYGNIDGTPVRQRFPEDLVFESEGVKVLITHIAGAFGKYTPQVKTLIKEHQPQVLICGHSHILKVMYDKVHQLLYLNPGACGNHGFHHVKTLLRFELESGQIKNLEVIELGKRSSVTSPHGKY